MLRWAVATAWSSLQRSSTHLAQRSRLGLAQDAPDLATSLLFRLLQRGFKKQANEIRAGNVLQRDGKLYVVTKAAYTQGAGRQLGNVTLDLKELQGSSKIIERCRPYDHLEAVTLDTRACQVLYTEGETVHVMQPDTYEQFEVPRSMWGEGADFLVDSLMVDVHFFEDQPITADLPIHVTLDVEYAAPHSKGDSVANAHKPATLAGGLAVKVPNYIVAGDRVVVDTRTREFVQRA